MDNFFIITQLASSLGVHHVIYLNKENKMKIDPRLQLHKPWIVVGLLCAANVFNYTDRYLFSALVPSLQRDLGFSDAQIGALGSVFLWGFILVSPFVGRLTVRLSRHWILALAVFFWSLATLTTGFFGALAALLIVRSILGASQSAFTAVAPTIVDDAVKSAWKGRALSALLMAIPVGSALGYMFGGVMEQAAGWQTTFICAGLASLPLAILVLFLPANSISKTAAGSWFADMRGLLASRRYILTVLGYAAQTFALGGFAFWAPTYLDRVLGLPAASGAVMFGGVVVVAGFAGTLIGGWLADRLAGGDRLRKYLLIGLVGTVIAAPFTYWAMLTHQPGLFFVCMLILQVAVFATLSPISSVFLGSVPPQLRASGMGMSLFFGKFLGDAISIWLIGYLSDLVHDLRLAMLIIPTAFLFNIVFWGVALIKPKKAAVMI